MLRSSTLSDCQWARSPCRRRSWALCPGRRLAPPLSSRGACQQPRVEPAVPGRTGRLPPRRMGSHAVFLAQRARASPFLYAAFRVLTAAWKRKEETLPPQSPRAHEGPRGAMQRPCGQCRVSPTSPPSPPSPRRLGGDGPQAGTSASIAAAASPPRRWGGGAGVRRAQPGRAPSATSDAFLPLQTRPARSQEAHALGQGRSHRQPALSNVPRPRGDPGGSPHQAVFLNSVGRPVGPLTLSAAVLGAVPGPPPGPATLQPRSLSTTPRRAGCPGADGPAPSAPHGLARGLPGSAGLGYPHPGRRVPDSRGSLLPGSGKRKRFLLSPRGPSWARGGSCCALPSLPSPPRPGGECLRAGSSASIAAAASLPPQMEGGWRSPRPAGPGPAGHFRHRSAPEAHPLAAVADFSTPTVGLGLALVPPGGG